MPLVTPIGLLPVQRSAVVRVVIIGGGFSGLYALRELAKNRRIEILLIDKHPYHCLQPQIYDLIANVSTVADMTVDLFNLCRGIDHPNLTFRYLRVTGIDFDARRIATEEGESVTYDYLILATGSRTAFPLSIEGIAKTNDIKKLHKALYFRQSFETEILNKIIREGRSCEPTEIIIIGAGLSGVEIAAEMAHYARKFFRRGRFACSNLKITLVSGSSTILPGLREKVVLYAQQRLRALGVDIITRTHMQRADDTFVYLDNGNRIRYSFIIYAGGVEAANLTGNLPLEKNKKGQILVNGHLQPEGYDNVFICGDTALIRFADGTSAVPNVTTAKISGRGAARNLLALLEQRPLETVNPEQSGILIALGGYYAVGDLYDKIAIRGFFAYLVKQIVFFRYRFPLLRYLKAGYAKRPPHTDA